MSPTPRSFTLLRQNNLKIQYVIWVDTAWSFVRVLSECARMPSRIGFFRVDCRVKE